MKSSEDKYFAHLARLALDKNTISPDMYEKYNVKHGLRNKDGSGVIVGLTDISTVVGYEKIGSKVKPVEGDLKYRGISIGDIVKGVEKDENKNAFAETTYLLLFGALPAEKELETFSSALRELSDLPKDFSRNILGTYHTPDVMNLIARSILTLYSKDKNPDDTSPENMVRQGMSLIAKLPTIIAYSHRIIRNWYHDTHLILRKTKKEYNLAENFLYKLRLNGKFTSLEAQVLNMCLVLHAEHGGGNNSTFSTRVVSSSGTDTYSAIAAAIGSLKGPLHGGANLRVIKMMEDLKAKVKDTSSQRQLESYIAAIVKKKAWDRSGKIYGFGHAVYTLSDPRTAVLRRYAEKLAREQGKTAEFELFSSFEKLAPQVFSDIKGGGKHLCANVDFYSGLVYELLNIPQQVFTPLFAMARISGWIAHRIEEVLVSKRIIRPAYKNTGRAQAYTSLEKRR